MVPLGAFALVVGVVGTLEIGRVVGALLASTAPVTPPADMAKTSPAIARVVKKVNAVTGLGNSKPLLRTAMRQNLGLVRRR
jgi:hypothetical protein